MNKISDKDKKMRAIFAKLAEQYYQQVIKPKEKLTTDETIHYAGQIYDTHEIKNLIEATLTFRLAAGKFSQLFEKELADFLGTKHCALTNSGSSANLLAISALTAPELGERRLKPGDEVISVACGFPTTVSPLIQNNLVPVFLDVDIGTYNIQANKIERAISPKTKAIFLSHTLGNPFNIKKILSLAKKYNLWLIEDNCDALGSKYKGRCTGTFGDISTFSFYAAHHITMGEGGALTTDNPKLSKLIKSFRDWGRDCHCQPGCDNACGKRFKHQLGRLPYGYDHKYIYSHIGYNLKVTEMQAAVGLAQLKKLPNFIKARRKNWQKLYQALKKYDSYFFLPQAEKDSEPSWFGFALTLKKDVGFTRNELVNFLEKNKISTRMLFAGNITRQPCFDDVKYRINGELKNTDYIMHNSFWIGVYPGITPQMIKYMIDTFDKFFKNYSA
jgi:CDP-6-deoxy-D-xylo-4-hexulose-3-dehydrase